jgi:hypothetical protein
MSGRFFLLRRQSANEKYGCAEHVSGSIYQRYCDRENTGEVIDGIELILVELKKFRAEQWSERKMAVLWLRFLKEVEYGTVTVAAWLKPRRCVATSTHRLKSGAIQSLSDRANPNRVQNPVRVTRDCDASPRELLLAAARIPTRGNTENGRHPPHAVTARPYKKIQKEEMTGNEGGIHARRAFMSIEKCFSQPAKTP